MSRLKSFTFLFFCISVLLFSSCGKSYTSSENSIPIDIYLNGPMTLSEGEIGKNDSLAILLSLIDGRMPQLNFHRLDLGDSIFRDTIEMGFFNGLFEELIDVNDMKEDLSNKVFGADLKAFLTIPRGKVIRTIDEKMSYLAIGSLCQFGKESQKNNLERIFIENSQLNNGRILVSFLNLGKGVDASDSLTSLIEEESNTNGGARTVGPVLLEESDSDGDGIVDKKDECPNDFGSKDDDGCPGIVGLTISNGGTVSWSGSVRVLYLSVRYSTARDIEIFEAKVQNGDKIKIPGVQNTNDQQYYIIKYGRSKGNLVSEKTVKCTNFL